MSLDECISLPFDMNDLEYEQASDSEVEEQSQDISSVYRYQPFSPTIWKPYGVGWDLPWSPEENTWDKIIPLHAPMGTATEWPFTLWLVEPKPTHQVALQDALERFETVRHSLNEEKTKN